MAPSSRSILIATESSALVKGLRRTFPARERTPSQEHTDRGRAGRVLSGPDYHLVSLTFPHRPKDLDLAPEELAWHLGTLPDTTAVLLVREQPGIEPGSLRVADTIASPGGGQTAYYPDLIAALPDGLEIGPVTDAMLHHCARWLSLRLGPHRIWALVLSFPGAGAERETQARFHRCLRGILAALQEQQR